MKTTQQEFKDLQNPNVWNLWRLPGRLVALMENLATLVQDVQRIEKDVKKLKGKEKE